MSEELPGLCLHRDGGDVMSDGVVQLACEGVTLMEPNPVELLCADDALVADRNAHRAGQQQHHQTA